MQDASDQSLVGDAHSCGLGLECRHDGAVQPDADGTFSRRRFHLDGSRAIPEFPEIIRVLHIVDAPSVWRYAC